MSKEFSITGRLDASNARSVQDSIDAQIKSLENLKNLTLVFDLTSLDYVSSAGLRVFLHFKKMVKDVCVKNVSSQVYEIFDVTGFTDLLTVEKAYREISVDGCEKLGEGANGVVYILDPETIIKVYKNPVLEDIKNERNLARTAFSHGIPTAISYDIVKVNNSYGTVFEFLNATTLSKIIRNDLSNINKYVKMYVDLLKTVHTTKLEGVNLPSAKDIFLSKLARCKKVLNSVLYNKIEAYVKSIKDDDVLIHGDFHTNNILVQNGEALLIDMDTLSLGNLAFEFVGVFISYVGFGEINPNETVSFFGLDFDFTRKFYNAILKEYFQSDNVEEQKLVFSFLGYVRLLTIYCHTRYSEDEKTQKQIKYIISKIEELLEKVSDK